MNRGELFLAYGFYLAWMALANWGCWELMHVFFTQGIEWYGRFMAFFALIPAIGALMNRDYIEGTHGKRECVAKAKQLTLWENGG